MCILLHIDKVNISYLLERLKQLKMYVQADKHNVFKILKYYLIYNIFFLQ